MEAGEGDFDSFIRRKDVRAWDSSFPMFRWETDIPASLLSGQIAGVGDVEEVAVTKRGAGGIASQITVTGNKGQAVIEGQSAIRSSLGNPALKIQRQDGTITAKGGGWLCKLSCIWRRFWPWSWNEPEWSSGNGKESAWL